MLPAPTQVAARPLRRKVIDPLGRTGVSVTPVRVAVNVTAVFSGEGLAGAGAEKLMVGVNAFTVTLALPVITA